MCRQKCIVEDMRSELRNAYAGYGDVRYAALPVPFQQRIYRFDKNNADFCYRYRHLEIEVSDVAVYIAHCFHAPDSIDAFYNAIYRKREELATLFGIPTLYKKYTAIYSLAYHFAAVDYDSVERVCGAVANSVGCAEYGCGLHESTV